MGKKVLLIADDIEMNRTVLKKFLQDFDVLEAEDGERTMEILHKRHVDLLLLDIIMPVLDGLQVLERLRSEGTFEHLGILVATSTKEKTERMVLSLGADDVVSKPYDPIVIQRRLENILAVKALGIQHILSDEGDNTENLRQKNEGYARQLEASAELLHKMAEIIKYSKSNPELLTEVAENMHREAENITMLISDNR